LIVNKTKNTKWNNMMNIKPSTNNGFGFSAMPTTIFIPMPNLSSLFVPIRAIIVYGWKYLRLIKTCVGTIFSTILFHLTFFSYKTSAAYFAYTINGIKRGMVRTPPPCLLTLYITKNLMFIPNSRNISDNFFAALPTNIFLRRLLAVKRVFKSIFITATSGTKLINTSAGMFGAKLISTFGTSYFPIFRPTKARAKIKTAFVGCAFCLKGFFTVITDSVKTFPLIGRTATAASSLINYWNATVNTKFIKSSVIVAFHLSQVYTGKAWFASGYCNNSKEVTA